MPTVKGGYGNLTRVSSISKTFVGGMKIRTDSPSPEIGFFPGFSDSVKLIVGISPSQKKHCVEVPTEGTSAVIKYCTTTLFNKMQFG